MNAINASDLKTQGINAIAMALADTQKVAISVQGVNNGSNVTPLA